MKKLFLISLAAVELVVAPAVRADVIAFNTSNTNANFDIDDTIGYEFTLANSVLVTELGFLDYSGTGLAQNVPVTIWNSAGAAVANATVPGGTTAGEINNFLYVSLSSPVNLPAGSYIIGGYVGDYDTEDTYYDTVTSAPGITYDGFG